MTNAVSQLTNAWSGYNLGSNPKVVAARHRDHPCLFIGTSSGDLYWLCDRGRGYRLQDRKDVRRSIHCLTVGDLDRDGMEECILGAGGQLVVYRIGRDRLEEVYTSRYLGGRVEEVSLVRASGSAVHILARVNGRGHLMFHWSGRGLILSSSEAIEATKTTLADINGDGYLEAVGVTSQQQLTVYSLSQGKPQSQWEEPWAEGGPGEVLKVVDVDHDGRMEIIMAAEERRRLIIREGRRGGRRLLFGPLFPEPIFDVVLGDWNGDGRVELIVATTYRVTIYSIVGWRLEVLEVFDVVEGVVSITIDVFSGEGVVVIILATRIGTILVLRPRFRPKSQFMVQETVSIPRGMPDAIKVAMLRSPG